MLNKKPQTITSNSLNPKKYKYVEWYTTSKPKYDSPTTTQTIMTWWPLKG
jgi:hypothetical protein